MLKANIQLLPLFLVLFFFGISFFECSECGIKARTNTVVAISGSIDCSYAAYCSYMDYYTVRDCADFRNRGGRTLAGWITSDAIALSAPPPTLILYLHTLTTFPTFPSHRYSNNNNSTWQRQRLNQQHRAKSLRSLYIGQSGVFPSLSSAI